MLRRRTIWEEGNGSKNRARLRRLRLGPRRNGDIPGERAKSAEGVLRPSSGRAPAWGQDAPPRTEAQGDHRDRTGAEEAGGDQEENERREASLGQEEDTQPLLTRKPPSLRSMAAAVRD